MAMARHVQHKEIAQFDGHPVITPLEDANEHLSEALRHSPMAINKEKFLEQISNIRAKLMFLEDAFGPRKFQH